MGQKTNSNIFRLGYKTNEWNSQYIEKNSHEYSLYVYQDLKIREFIDRFFRRSNLLIHHCKIKRSNNSLEIFISYYVTLRAFFLINKINQDQNILIKRKNKVFSRKRKKIFKERLYIIRRLKKK